MVVYDDRGIIVKADVGTVRSVNPFLGANDDRAYNILFLDDPARRSTFHRGDDDVADVAGLAERTAQHFDTHDFFGAAAVVGNFSLVCG